MSLDVSFLERGASKDALSDGFFMGAAGHLGEAGSGADVT